MIFRLLASFFVCTSSLRLSTLNECTIFNGRRVALVNLNGEYLRSGLFFNWYHYAQPFLDKAQAQLVIAISDEDRYMLGSMEHILPHDVAIISPRGDISFPRRGGITFLQTSQLNEESRLGDPFGSKGFQAMMVNRVAMIKKLLEHGCTVLQVDIDTAWLANPFDDIDMTGGHMMIFTDDDPQNKYHKNGKKVAWGSYLCACFMYFTPGVLKTNFFWKWMSLSRWMGNEQNALNIVLAWNQMPYFRWFDVDKPFDFDVLPFEHYAPLPSTGKDAHIVHANFLVGLKNKTNALHEHNVWHESTDQWLREEDAAWLTLFRKEMGETIKHMEDRQVMLFHTCEWDRTKLDFDKLPNMGVAIFIIDDPFHSCCKSIDNIAKLADDPRILAFGVENYIGPPHPKIQQLPIGFESSLMVGRYGDQILHTFKSLARHPIPYAERKYNLQSDAQLHVFQHPKSGLKNDRQAMIDGIQMRVVDNWYTTHLPFEDHLRIAANSRLALCPEGNGVDTHRFYHNYAMGTRCVVKKGILTPLYAQFPGTIFVDSWADVNEANVSRWLEEDRPKQNVDLLRASYWIEKVLSIANLPQRAAKEDS